MAKANLVFIVWLHNFVLALVAFYTRQKGITSNFWTNPRRQIHFYSPAGSNLSEIELTQCLVFFSVSLSPLNTCPR